jgi:hypothetical protein
VGEETEVLKDHGDLAAAKLQQLLLAHGVNVLSLIGGVTAGGLQKLVKAADNGGFSGTGKADNDKDLSPSDLEIHIPQGHGGPGLLKNGGFLAAGLHQLGGPGLVVAVNHGNMAGLQNDIVSHAFPPPIFGPEPGSAGPG